MRRSTLILVGIVLAVVLGGGFWTYLSLTFKPRDWTSRWPTFYKEKFSAYFKIPPEAEIISAIENPVFMGEFDRIVFRLPQSKTSAEWVSEVAEASGIGGFRQSDIWYDASHIVEGRRNKYLDTITDIYLIRYRTEDQTFEAIWGWD